VGEAIGAAGGGTIIKDFATSSQKP
jgi:hypothetical protein